jgi:predicted secreted protein
MSQGYSGRRFYLTLDNVRIAAVRTKGSTFTREPIDTTTDDDDGWRELLGEPGRRSVDANVAGVMTAANAGALLTEWEGNLNSDIVIELPDGREVTAAEGFFLGNLEFGGEETGPTTFSAQLQSSGEVTMTPASS